MTSTQFRKQALPGLILAVVLFASARAGHAFEPPLQIYQYSHTSWTARDGYSLGLVFAMAQTPDGYLWLGGEFGLFRFDGLRFTAWQPPAGRELPHKPYSLLVARDGTLWIGTFEGLVSWNGVELTHYPEVEKGFVTSLLEDRDGTIWAGVLADKGRLCEIRKGRATCHVHDGAFGAYVWSLVEDGAGALWAGADSGLWRWKPGPPRHYETPGKRVGDLATSADGKLLIGIRDAGLMRIASDALESFPIRDAANGGKLLSDQNIASNKLLRDREGGLWIGSSGRGLLHVQDGVADTFHKGDGLSGNIACSLFQDREGNIWYASERGLDRFRKLPITTVSARQGLASDLTRSITTSRDGSLWVATQQGVTRWKDRKATIFREAEGLAAFDAQSLYADPMGRVWVSTAGGLARFSESRFVAVDGLPSKDVSSISGDEAGNLWLSGNNGLARFHDGRFIDNIAWSAFGRRQQAKVVISDRGGVWLAFWQDGGVLYVKDGKVLVSYSAADGLGRGHVSGLRLAEDGALWVATEEGGLSRIKEGRITTLTTDNGLPCNSIHWTIEDDHGDTWLYSGCGLMRVLGDEMRQWIVNPAHKVRAKLWGTADGVTLRSVTPAYFNPPVTKTTDGRIWFVGGDGAQVIDPDHLPFNPIAPPVFIEKIVADRQAYAPSKGLRLPPRVRDLTIDFTALSLVDPRNVVFRYKLEGHDRDWREARDQRQATYTNLAPGRYHFHVTAANNSGVWNEQGAQIAFLIAPALYQTTWFRFAGVLLLMALVWAGVRIRIQRLRDDRKRLRDLIEGIPAMAFSVNPDGSPDLVNQRWLDYAGLSTRTNDDSGWKSVIHPVDVEGHTGKWQHALATGVPFENEARHRGASGEYRWFLVQAVPLRDKQGRIVKWYGTLTDIEERKRSEEERERLQRLEAHLAHTNRVSMLGELTASLAHEINQPIGAVVASAGAGLRWLDREQPELERAREAIRRIKDDGKRAADIIAGLKAFYRKGGAPQRVLLDVNEVVREMLILLRREAERHSVVMRTELSADVALVRADRVQLQQVLMNLMVNGIEAMRPAGGQLTIRTKSQGDEVMVSVSDTGVGIAADQLDTIFSAFVTTKPAGTGMGLAISRTIIESHEGKLWAERNEGPGATFHFTLPGAPG
jgi:PAS domain S-box-containing protein